MTPEGPNAQQIEYWNEQAGPKWVAQKLQLDKLIHPLGLRALEGAKASPGERVLDVGCGTGQATLLLAERVGEQGRVLGIDVSAVMLEEARQAARQAGATQLRFEQADAQTHEFSAEFDLLFSRFGVMFFSDPTAAFHNLRGALAADGRLVFVCWQKLSRNPWMGEPMMAAYKHLSPPAPPQPGAPGPFAFADPERVRGILQGAGFSSVDLESVDQELTLGSGVDEAMEFMVEFGPVSTALRDAEVDAGSELGTRVKQELRDTLARYDGADGVRLPSASWIVTAQR